MSVVRRLLMAGGGGGSFATPSLFSPVALTTAPDGGWSWFGDPHAVYDASSNKTFFGYLAGDSGDVCIRSYDHATDTVSAETVLHAALEVDDHDNPGIFVRPSDGKVVAFYSAHVGAAIYKRISSSAGSVASFAAEVNLDSSFAGDGYTYPTPIYLSNADGAGPKLFLFVRNHVGGTDPQWWYIASTDDGSTFGAHTNLHSITYSKVEGNGVDRIDLICSDHPGAGATKIYHIYRQSSAWHQSDGTALAGALPYDEADMTTVYDGGAKLVWVWDVAYAADGSARIAFVKFESTTDHRYMYARWTGSAWVITEIVAGGTYVATDLGFNADQVYYSGGVVLDHADPTVAWCAVGVGGGVWELRRYVTSDDGATWSATTVEASGKNIRPSAVRGHVSELQVVWMAGRYDSYVDYSADVIAAGT